jgi:hypothetical protein
MQHGMPGPNGVRDVLMAEHPEFLQIVDPVSSPRRSRGQRRLDVESQFGDHESEDERGETNRWSHGMTSGMHADSDMRRDDDRQRQHRAGSENATKGVWQGSGHAPEDRRKPNRLSDELLAFSKRVGGRLHVSGSSNRSKPRTASDTSAASDVGSQPHSTVDKGSDVVDASHMPETGSVTSHTNVHGYEGLSERQRHRRGASRDSRGHIPRLITRIRRNSSRSSSRSGRAIVRAVGSPNPPGAGRGGGGGGQAKEPRPTREGIYGV